MKPLYLTLLLLVAIVASAVVFYPPSGGVPATPPDPSAGHGTGIPTVTTNVTYWTFRGLLTGQLNAGGSGAGPTATVTLQPGSTDLRGTFDFLPGATAPLVYTNLITVIFSKPFATPPEIQVVFASTNLTVYNSVPMMLRDVTTTNFLLISGPNTIGGNRVIGTYQVFP